MYIVHCICLKHILFKQFISPSLTTGQWDPNAVAIHVARRVSLGLLHVSWFCSSCRRNHNHIWQVLMYARTVFYKINTSEPLNPEAAVLWVTAAPLHDQLVIQEMLCTQSLVDVVNEQAWDILLMVARRWTGWNKNTFKHLFTFKQSYFY